MKKIKIGPGSVIRATKKENPYPYNDEIAKENGDRAWTRGAYSLLISEAEFGIEYETMKKALKMDDKEAQRISKKMYKDGNITIDNTNA